MNCGGDLCLGLGGQDDGGRSAVPEARSAGGRSWGWVSGGCRLSREAGSGVSPRKNFEFTDVKSCILAHFDSKNYLLQTHQCSRKE
jgi:hypothetical protein